MLPLSTLPFGKFALAPEIALRTSSIVNPRRLTASGMASTRTAGNAPPPTVTSPTPGIWDIFWANTVEAASYNCARLKTSDVIERIMIGAPAGLTFRYEGLDGMVGRVEREALRAA